MPDKVKGNAHYHALCADGVNKKDIPIRGEAVAIEKQRDYKADESRNRACKPAYDPCVVLKAFAGEIHLIVVDPDVHILLGELQARGKRVADAERHEHYCAAELVIILKEIAGGDIARALSGKYKALKNHQGFILEALSNPWGEECAGVADKGDEHLCEAEHKTQLTPCVDKYDSLDRKAAVAEGVDHTGYCVYPAVFILHNAAYAVPKRDIFFLLDRRLRDTLLNRAEAAEHQHRAEHHHYGYDIAEGVDIGQTARVSRQHGDKERYNGVEKVTELLGVAAHEHPLVGIRRNGV